MKRDWRDDDINLTRIILKIINGVVDKSNRLLQSVVGFPISSDQEFIPCKEILIDKCSHHDIFIIFKSPQIKCIRFFMTMLQFNNANNYTKYSQQKIMANTAAHVPRSLKFHEQSIRNFVQNSSFLNSTSAFKENNQNQNRIIMASTQPNFANKPKGFDFYNKNNLLLKACNVEDIQYIDKNPLLFQQDIVILPEKAVTNKKIKIQQPKRGQQFRSKTAKDFSKAQKNEEIDKKSKEAELNEFLFNYRKNEQQKRNRKLKFLADVESRINSIEQEAANLGIEKQRQYEEINGILKIHTEAAQFARKAEMVGKLNSALQDIQMQNHKLPSPTKITQDMQLLQINAAVQQHREYNDALLDQIEKVSRSKSKQKLKGRDSKPNQSGYKTGMKQKLNNWDHPQGSLSKTLKRPMQIPPKPSPASKKLTSTMKGKN